MAKQQQKPADGAIKAEMIRYHRMMSVCRAGTTAGDLHAREMMKLLRQDREPEQPNQLD